jgi:hypothetical protein
LINLVIQNLVSPEILKRGGQVSFTPKELMEITFQIIDESDLVIIDLSEKGVGLGIEADYAYSRSVPVITREVHT